MKPNWNMHKNNIDKEPWRDSRKMLKWILLQNSGDKWYEGQGYNFINVNQPICEKVDNINKIRWNIIKPSEMSEVATDTYIAIVTKFKELKSYKMLAFVGSRKKQLSRDENHILLALIFQNTMESSIESIDVLEMFCDCNATKHNINKASSSYHNGIGGVYGFGAWKDFRVDENNRSSVKPFAFKDGKDKQNSILEGCATKGLEGARKAVTRFMGYDLHLLNVALEAK